MSSNHPAVYLDFTIDVANYFAQSLYIHIFVSTGIRRTLVPKRKIKFNSLCQDYADCNVELSKCHTTCLPICHFSPTHTDRHKNDFTRDTCANQLFPQRHPH